MYAQNIWFEDFCFSRLISFQLLTDSNKDDVTTAFVSPPVLMFARTGAPNPIEESCRLSMHKESNPQKQQKMQHV